MPTSRYESYPKPSLEVEAKEEIVGEERLTRALGKTALEPTEED